MGRKPRERTIPAQGANAVLMWVLLLVFGAIGLVFLVLTVGTVVLIIADHGGDDGGWTASAIFAGGLSISWGIASCGLYRILGWKIPEGSWD